MIRTITTFYPKIMTDEDDNEYAFHHKYDTLAADKNGCVYFLDESNKFVKLSIDRADKHELNKVVSTQFDYNFDILLCKFVYECWKGPITKKGKILNFKDGNMRNCALDNLSLDHYANKKKCQEYHFDSRLKSRYNIVIEEKDKLDLFKDLKYQMANVPHKAIKRTNRISIHMLNFIYKDFDDTIPIVYDKLRGSFVTVLPKNNWEKFDD